MIFAYFSCCSFLQAEKKLNMPSNSAKSSDKVKEEVSDYYASDETHQFYTQLWGEGNIHFGYFPEHKETTYEEAAYELTLKMAEMSGINKHSRVIDLGCGYGKPALDLCDTLGCSAVGVDLGAPHIKIAKQLAARRGLEQQASFYVGSFTDLPVQVKDKSFTHVFTQAAFCHAQSQLDEVLASCAQLLKRGGGGEEGGCLVINDCVSDKAPDARTLEYVYKRMSFPCLVSTSAYCDALKRAGFVVEQCVNWDEHFHRSYQILAERAARSGRDLLAKKYEETCHSIRRQQYGMVTIVARFGSLSLSLPKSRL